MLSGDHEDGSDDSVPTIAESERTAFRYKVRPNWHGMMHWPPPKI
jgi:hypothetical protein